MFSKIFNIRKSVQISSNDQLPTQQVIDKIVFELKYKDISIGFLEFTGNKWLFFYSESFKLQNEISPIVSFPDMNKKYQGSELWSFFSSRIPDNIENSSSLEEQHSRNHKKTNENLIQLLKSHGRKTITNPFDLSVA